MTESDVLFFFQSQSDVPDNFEGQTFIIESSLDNLSEEQYSDIYKNLINMNVTSGTTLPIYKLCRCRLFLGEFSERVPSLVVSIHLASQIEDVISKKNIDNAIIKTVDGAYEPIILDILNNHGLAVSAHRGLRLKFLYSRIYGKIKSLAFAIVILLDQLICFLLSPIFKTKEQNSVGTIFVPSQNRFKTTEPVLKQMESTYALIIDQALLTRLMNRDLNTAIGKYDPIPSHQLTTPKTTFQGFRYILFSFLPSEILLNETEKSVSEKIEKEFGFELGFTLGQMFGQLYHNGLLRQIQKYFVYRGAFSKTGADNVVVSTGYSPAAEAIWLAGKNSNVTAYDLPHMITVNPPQTGVFTDYSFVTGPFAQEYIERHYPKQTSSVLPTGRPYLETLNRSSNWSVKESIDVLIATSPYDDEKRKQLLFQSVTGIKKMPATGEIKIKPHPSEDVRIYEELQEEVEIPFEIIQDGLREELETADLVITVNSNVGLEAIVSGSISININFWSGMHLPLPYSLEGSVPILESPTSVQTFFRDLTLDRAKSLQKEQQEFIVEGYCLNGSAERVASEIETTRTK